MKNKSPGFIQITQETGIHIFVFLGLIDILIRDDIKSYGKFAIFTRLKIGEGGCKGQILEKLGLKIDIFMPRFLEKLDYR